MNKKAQDYFLYVLFTVFVVLIALLIKMLIGG